MRKVIDTRLGWIDLLRIIACFLVVIAHCCDHFVAQFDNNRFEFLSGAFWGSFARASVPLFVMMTGVLILPATQSMSEFYRKRVSRIIIPLIFWSMLLPVLYYFYFASGITTESPAISMDNHTVKATLTSMLMFMFNFTYSSIPLWYLYMLVGLYLIIPIINGWLVQASKKELEMFLGLWLISLCMPYIKMAAPFFGYLGNYGSMGILGVCEWNPYGTFYYMSGFIGYLVLSFYLMKHPLQWSKKKTNIVASVLFIIGYAITSLGFVLTQKYFPGSYANLEIVWYFSGINVFMMTFAVFIFFQKFTLPSSAMLRTVASLTFGIYLCHFFIVQVVFDLTRGISCAPYIIIPINAVITFVVSAIIVWLMSKSKLLQKVTM